MTNKNAKFLIIKALCLLFGVFVIYHTGGCIASSAGAEPKNKISNDSVDSILEQLKEKAAELKSYQCGIEYKFSQPLLESETLRKGILYYQKSDGRPSFANATEGRSALRINFQTLKQDDGQEEEYIEQYIFDGVWLTHIDYQIKEVKRYQQTEPNKPVDAFDLVRENFPLIGFSKADELEKEFEIKLVERTEKEHPSVIPAEPVLSGVEGAGIQDFVQLHLKTRADSIYKDDYTSIDFWIDKKLCLPAKIVATSTEGDIYEIRLLDAKVNEKINDDVFEVKIPEGFGVETEPLKR